MKGRPKLVRKISFMPIISGFKPYGENVTNKDGESVFLLYEEYEALRLNDYEKHSQCEAAMIMEVSRPTFTQIYMSARQKIAKAFVEGRKIIVEGGKVELDSGWYWCNNCNAMFSLKEEKETVCALCGSNKVIPCKLPQKDIPMEIKEIQKRNVQGQRYYRRRGQERRTCHSRHTDNK